jgi:hypothetical protein
MKIVKRFMYFIVGIILLNSTIVIADTLDDKASSSRELTLLFDTNMSPIVGANLVYDIAQLYDVGILSLTESIKSTQHNNRLLYLAKLILDYTATTDLITYQHELFGHAARLREFGVAYTWEVNHGAVLSGESVAGSVSYTLSDYHKLTSAQQLAMSIGGIEASQVLANQLAVSMFQRGKISSINAWLYWRSAYDFINYANSTSTNPTDNSSGNDLMSYTNEINSLYGRTVISISDVQQHSNLNYIDPLLWLSLYTISQTAVSKNNAIDLPMFNIGELGYLPSLRSILTPYGLETQLVNYFSYQDMQGQLIISSGNTASQSSSGIGINVSEIAINDKLELAASWYMWQQPELYLAASSTQPVNWGEAAQSKFGMLLALTGKLIITHDIKALLQIGYKDKGFVQGEILDKGMYYRGGISYMW